jgi:putative transcriptional regulator
MSLRKLCFYAILATILTFAAAEKLNRHRKEFDVPEMDTRAHGPSLAASLRAGSEMPPADFLPVQSKNAQSLGAGKLLVASRNLGDPHFAKTVILLVRYDAQGVLGLILNRRTAIPLSRALESVKAAKDRSDPVYLGGPVETPAVFALFQSPAKIEGAEKIFDGVYLITSKPLFEQTISARPDASVFHVYLGYAGWTQDQLQKEVELGAWFIFPAEASTVFNADPDSLWLEMIRKTELQLARSEPGDADPRTCAGQFAELSGKRWNSTHFGPVPSLAFAPLQLFAPGVFLP